MDADYTAPTANLYYQAGYDWSFPITKTSSPVSMAGWTWSMLVREDEGSDSVLVATFTMDVSQASSGVVTGTVAKALTAEVDPGTYWYEISVTRSGVEEPFLRGAFEVQKGSA